MQHACVNSDLPKQSYVAIPKLVLDTFFLLFQSSFYFHTAFIPLSHFLDLYNIVSPCSPCSSAGVPRSRVGSTARTLSIFHVACNSFHCLVSAQSVLSTFTHAVQYPIQKGTGRMPMSALLRSLALMSTMLAVLAWLTLWKTVNKVFCPTFIFQWYFINIQQNLSDTMGRQSIPTKQALLSIYSKLTRNNETNDNIKFLQPYPVAVTS